MSASVRGHQARKSAENESENWAEDGLLAKEEQRILRDRGLSFTTFAGQRQRARMVNVVNDPPSHSWSER